MTLQWPGADSRWWTVLMVAVGALLGGYLGAAIAWVAWSTVGRIARDERVNPAARIAAAIVGIAGGTLVYNLALLLLALSPGG